MPENVDNIENQMEKAEKKKGAGPVSLRLDQQTRDAFTDYCTQNKLTREAALSSLLHAVELGRAAESMPDRAAEVINVNRLIAELQASFLASYEQYLNTTGNVREEFRNKIESQQLTIEDLQGKKKELEEKLAAADQIATEAKAARIEAENAVKTADQLRASAEQTAADKQTIADTLAAKLAEAESKLTEYDKIKTEVATNKEQIRELEQQIKDKDRDATEAAKEAERSLKDAVVAEREKAQAEKDTLKDQIRQVEKDAEAAKGVLMDQLRAAKSEAEAAKKDAETAKATALAEVAEQHQAEIAKLQARISELTDQLIANKKAGK